MIIDAVKVLMLFVSLPALLACDDGPDEAITHQLDAAHLVYSMTLLSTNVSKLNDWILRKQKYYDSTHQYIFDNVLFRDLYKNSRKHFIYTKMLMQNKNIDVNIKKTLIKVSICLDLEDYLELGRLIIDTGEPELMTVFISPGHEYGSVLSENYSEPEVVRFSSEVLKKYPLIKSTVEFILSGSYLKQVNEYRNFGEQLPVLNCSDTA